MEYINIFYKNNKPTGEIKEKTQAHEDAIFTEQHMFGL